MRYFVFDLDGTVIDSRHRYKTLENGDIDLEHWIANAAIREQVFKDTLLPLAAEMKRRYYSDYVIICTSRAMTQHDFDYLDAMGLHSDAILFRPEGVMDGCADLKEFMLDEFFDSFGTCIENETVVMYEDHLGVIDRLRTRGVFCSVEGYK